MKRDRGLFIVLEGIDGAGKTSIAKKLLNDLEANGYNVVYTYEPYDTYYVEALKKHYNDYRDAYLDALTYAADRLIHVKTVIEPYLMKKYIVICDRYYYSSVAYQAAQGAPYEWVLEINRFALKPDIAIYLDVSPEIGLRRRSGLLSRFPEYEALDFLERVRAIYHRLVEDGYLIEINANRSFEEVYSNVYSTIVKLIK